MMMTVATQKSGSYMPRSDTELRYWFLNFAEYAREDHAACGVSASEAAELKTLADEYEAALDQATNPATRTADTIALKDAARDRAIRGFRTIAARIRTDSRIDETVKVALGIPPPRKGPRQRVPAPKTSPLLNIMKIQPGAHILSYADSATPDSRKKPHGVKQLQVFVAIGRDGPNAGPEHAKYIDSFTRTPFEVPCRKEDAGQLATYYARWVTGTALVGPWSLPVSMTVIEAVD